ncbi:putative PAS/PAC sensor protein [Methanofollis liminatans DSM 4140]|uniref:histidine kinase n=1 Tax=Methanofollis liminatans DSM 4140 TaxID=28892 RepID=J1AQ84_9EURY|nr:PAS domain-containing protein [Methanofollis liminatans]EJG07113.1 putative PAS/PAC sensor protein [Methanofollis liminatans DSM 4140]
MSATSSGICLFREETICFVNPAFTALFGYTPEEAVGNLPVSDIVHPDDRERFRRTTEQVLSGASISVHERYEGIRKDGSSLCLEYTGAGTRYHGKPAAVGLFLDMAAQKKVEDALRGSEERFRAIFDRVNDVIFLVELTPDNRPGRLIEVNRAACTSLHYQRGKLLNMPVGKVKEPGGGTVLAEIMERLLLYGTAKYEAVELRKDGTPLPVELNSHLCEIDGRSAILAVARDISARKEWQSMEAEAFSRSRRTWSSSPSSTTILNTPFR